MPMQFFLRFDGKSHLLSSSTVETIDDLFLAVEVCYYWLRLADICDL